MEKFLLCGIAAGNKLNIVHKKIISLAVFFAEFRSGLVFNGGNKLVCKLFAFNINNKRVGFAVFNLVHNGKKKMGFSKAAVAVNKQGVIVSCVVGGYRKGGRMGKFI